MPSSTINQVALIMHMANVCRPTAVLDVGVGSGRYGYLLREQIDPLHLPEQWRGRIDGIEAFADYLTPVHRYVYSQIMVGSLFAVLPGLADQRYDLVLLIDVLEHLERPDGEVALGHLLRVGKTVVVSTPKEWIEQGAVFGNEQERHRSLWGPGSWRG